MSAYIMGVLKMQFIQMMNCALHYIGNNVLQFNVYLTLNSVNGSIYFRDCDRKTVGERFPAQQCTVRQLF